MMRSATMIALVATCHAAEMAASSQDIMDQFADQFVDRLLDRLETASPEQGGLDQTTLGKAANVAMAPQTRARAFLAPTPRLAPMGPVHTMQMQPRHVKTYAATIDAKTVKTLRDSTGAGMMECKKALVECDGNLEEAMAFLRKKGLASADKKAGRSANEGVVEAYIHAGSKMGVMVELNCETDFVAKNPEFKDLARNIAMQVAASPTVEVVSEADIDADFLAKEKEILAQAEDLKGKPENIIGKIVEGRVGKIIKTKTLLDQAYIKDPDQTVDALVKSSIAKFGENIKVARFVRFNVGGE
eukprot:gnl/TRDRNA2_/TRDRNA2_182696_c0_seq1.p1 gnl/TRDRNA2_/TRDRNA2_182696_c0~~gnl/TRDRNA2_/TRDRNA2_182696_c0_seq1.p1  ORF type:complete len:301 (+),score=95.29 gnl/TRDRNA2_/TRDRNA2_182696_c0_seq1:81-983(+)